MSRVALMYSVAQMSRMVWGLTATPVNFHVVVRTACAKEFSLCGPPVRRTKT
jgi:hypothetical protein